MVSFASEQGVYVYKKPPVHISLSTENSLPQTFVPEQNHPNPFNPMTTINFQLPSVDYFDLTIYNLPGQKIRTLANGRKEAGKYKVAFNAAALPSGVYYYTLSVGNRLLQARKMLLLR